MAVKKKTLQDYTVALHCVDTLTRYVAHIALVDLSDKDALENEVVNWLDDNTNEPEGWTSDCFVIDAIFEGVHQPLQAGANTLEGKIKKHTNGERIIRELSLGDDLYLVMCDDKHGAVSVLEFALNKGEWGVDMVVQLGDYCEAMDCFVQYALDHQSEYHYEKTVKDPF